MTGFADADDALEGESRGRVSLGTSLDDERSQVRRHDPDRVQDAGVGEIARRAQLVDRRRAHPEQPGRLTCRQERRTPMGFFTVRRLYV
jgi:hypothetical protein